MNRTASVCGVRVDLASAEQHLESLRRTVSEKRKMALAYVNAHAVNLAQADRPFREYINTADAVVADGQGIRLACRFLRKPIPPHLPLTSWIWSLLETCRAENFSVFFLGSSSETMDAVVRIVGARLPHLRICGSHHGYFTKTGEESQRVIQFIDDSSPDVLFVGFGMPLQEYWIRENFDRLPVRAVVPVGGCFEIIAGRHTESPRFMRTIGLEWLWRIVQEPGRLFTRYVLGIPMFLWRVANERMRGDQERGSQSA